MSMLYEVMHSIRNFFPVPGGYHDGHYEIENGKVNLPFLIPGQYYLVEGSVLNDGVYKYGEETDLADEAFDGTVTALKIPPRFLPLVADIEAWQASSASTGPFVSESFGGYSYQRETNGKGGAATWDSHFASRLNEWRRIR